MHHRLDQPGRKPIDYCLMDPLYLNISCVRTCSLCVWHVAEVRRPEANAAEYGAGLTELVPVDRLTRRKSASCGQAGSSWLLSMRRPGCCRTTVRWDRFGSGRKGCACLLAILPASSSSYSDFLQLTQNSAHARAHFEESLEHLPWCCAVWWLSAVESPIQTRV